MTLSPGQGLALIRAAFGLYFVVSALRKTLSGWLGNGEELTQFVGRNLEAAEPFYASFLDTVVVPNATTFAQLIVLGEWVTGVTLLLGLFTRLGGLAVLSVQRILPILLLPNVRIRESVLRIRVPQSLRELSVLRHDLLFPLLTVWPKLLRDGQTFVVGSQLARGESFR